MLNFHVLSAVVFELQVNLTYIIHFATVIITFPFLYLDQLEAGLVFVVEGTQSFLQGRPGNSLSTACPSYQNGGVVRILGFIKLNNFCHSIRCRLQATLKKRCLDGLFKLQENKKSKTNSFILYSILLSICRSQ